MSRGYYAPDIHKAVADSPPAIIPGVALLVVVCMRSAYPFATG